jgi:quinol-cytochrome oxidoreductase complex cytochrome b subunit
MLRYKISFFKKKKNIFLKLLQKLGFKLYKLSISYGVPLNINIFWNFGVLAFFFLISQIVTGIFLAMHYVPNLNLAFISVEHIMRDVNNG